MDMIFYYVNHKMDMILTHPSKFVALDSTIRVKSTIKINNGVQKVKKGAFTDKDLSKVIFRI